MGNSSSAQPPTIRGKTQDEAGETEVHGSPVRDRKARARDLHLLLQLTAVSSLGT